MIFGISTGAQKANAGDIAGYLERYETGFFDYLGAVTGDSFYTSTPGIALRSAMMPDDDRTVTSVFRGPAHIERTSVPIIPEAEWPDNPYYRPGVPWNDRMTENRAKTIAEYYDEDHIRRWLRDQRPMGWGTAAAAVIGSLAGAAPDPVNYIPWVGIAGRLAAGTRIAAMAGRVATGLEATRGGGIALASAKGAIDGLIGTAAVEPYIVSSRRQLGDDIGFAGIMMDIGLGALLGGAFSGGVHAWKTRAGSYHPKTTMEAGVNLKEGMDQVAAGKPINVSTPSFGAAGSFRRQLMESTSAAGLNAGSPAMAAVAPVATAPGAQGGRALGSVEVPVIGADGQPVTGRQASSETSARSARAKFEKKDAAKREAEAAAGHGRRPDPENPNRYQLVQQATVKLVDGVRFGNRQSAEQAVKRMSRAERESVGIAELKAADGSSEFVLFSAEGKDGKGLGQGAVKHLEGKPEVIGDMIAKSEAARAADAGAPNNPASPLEARAWNTASPPEPHSAPLEPPPALPSKPNGNPYLDEAGFNPEAAALDAESVKAIEAEGRIDKEDKAALRDAEASEKKSQAMADGFKAAASCLARK